VARLKEMKNGIAFEDPDKSIYIPFASRATRGAEKGERSGLERGRSECSKC
jgi:hypothetical protein